MLQRYSAALAALLISVSARAQQEPAATVFRHSVELGFGSGLMGSGDYGCQKNHLGYSYAFNRYFSLSSRAVVVRGSEPLLLGPFSLPQSYRAMNWENELSVTPFGNHRRLIPSVGVGGFAGHLRQRSYLVAGYYIEPNGEAKLQTTPDNVNDLNYGYMVSLNLDAAVDPAKRWLVGTRAAFQNDRYGNTYVGWQLRIGRRF
jgi:hypothetical protein